MDSEFENEEMVQIQFQIHGYCNYLVSKKDWVKKWKDKIVNPRDFSELGVSYSELISDRSTLDSEYEEWVQFDQLSPA